MKIFHITPILFQRFVWPFARIGFIWFGHLKIRGLENITHIKSNVIFASNHTSEIDGFLVAASVPFWSHFLPMYSVSRERAFYTESGWRKYIYGSLLFNFIGAPQVRSGFRDYEIALMDHIELLEHGKSILIHPEGRISNHGIIGEARGGVAYLARRTGKPIVPVSISGAHRIGFLNLILRRRHIIVTFGSAITVDDLALSVNYDTLVHENIYRKEAEYIMLKVQDILSKI